MDCVCIKKGCLFSDDDIGSVYGLGMCMWLKQRCLCQAKIHLTCPSDIWKNVTIFKPITVFLKLLGILNGSIGLMQIDSQQFNILRTFRA